MVRGRFRDIFITPIRPIHLIILINITITFNLLLLHTIECRLQQHNLPLFLNILLLAYYLHLLQIKFCF